jgi:lipopolysaccharide export system protein LptA
VQNKEAARYARWSAAIAGSIALVVAGVYAQRAIRESHARHAAPTSVPAGVQQRSQEFSFSKVEQDRTIFKVRASQATQFSDQNRSLLKDVWITIYGRDGLRNDNIHAHECSYEPTSGAIECEGDVQIDIEDANPPPGKPASEQLEVKTRNLSFNRETGEASTSEAVEFRFAQGQGQGAGVLYSTRDSVVLLEHNVEFTIAPSDHTSGLPVQATGSSLEINRNNHIAVLAGPAVVREGDRELSAEKISIELDADFHARRAIAEGQPAIRSSEHGAQTAISAERFEAFLGASGWIEHITAFGAAPGNVAGTRQSSVGTDHFSAGRVEVAMLPENNLVREMTTSGGTSLDSHQGSDSRSLKTDTLRVTFAAGGQSNQQPGNKQTAEQQHVNGFETLAPGTIETKAGREATVLRAKKLVGQFGSDGRLERLLGHSGAEVRHQMGEDAPQISSATELAATFAKGGDWDTLDQSGNVRFQQSDRQANAARARIVRSTDTITLDGSPVLSDAQSRTTAGSVAIGQKSGDIRATGNIVSTYLSATESPARAPTQTSRKASAPGDAINLGSGPAHISADALSGSTTSGHVIYTGHARLWQGESVLDSDKIELWREEKKMQAAGHVVAVFSQASGQVGAPQFGKPSKPSSTAKSSGAQAAQAGPTLWNIHAPRLTYWSDEGKAHLEGGVTAKSQDGSLESPTLDVFLSHPAPSTTGVGATPAAGSGQLQRALALGGAVVRQGDRLGMAEQAEYTAADGKFVLSGGKPTITDASSDTTTGRSLTFYIASDTILVDSQEGSRTLTKHRVDEK